MRLLAAKRQSIIGTDDDCRTMPPSTDFFTVYISLFEGSEMS